MSDHETTLKALENDRADTEAQKEIELKRMEYAALEDTRASRVIWLVMGFSVVVIGASVWCHAYGHKELGNLLIGFLVGTAAGSGGKSWMDGERRRTEERRDRAPAPV